MTPAVAAPVGVACLEARAAVARYSEALRALADAIETDADPVQTSFAVAVMKRLVDHTGGEIAARLNGLQDAAEQLCRLPSAIVDHKAQRKKRAAGSTTASAEKLAATTPHPKPPREHRNGENAESK